MLIRPKGLALVECSLIFNQSEYEKVEIDLDHVNKFRRSNFEAYQVYLILEHLIKGVHLEANDKKEFGDVFCYYFVVTGEAKGKYYKVVFCICSDRPNAIGVITLYQLKGV